MRTTTKREKEILMAFHAELVNAEIKHPCWSDDAVHAAAILNEEAGELIQAALAYHYGNGDKGHMESEAVQCGAMALRFLLNLENFRRG